MVVFIKNPPEKKPPQWRFVPCLEASDFFQSIADASPLFIDDKVSLWYLLVSLLSLPSVLEVESIWKWGGAKTCSPLLVHPANRFLCKEKWIYLSILVMSVPISATVTQTHLLLKEKWFAQGLRESGMLRLDALVTSTCTCAELPKCAQFWRKKFAPYTL